MEKETVRFLIMFIVASVLLSVLVGCEVAPSPKDVVQLQSDLGDEVMRISYGNNTPSCADHGEFCTVDLDCCKGYMCGTGSCVEPPWFCEHHELSTILGITGIVLLFLSVAGQSFFGLWISHVFAKIGYRKIPFLILISLGFILLLISISISGFC